MAKKGKSDKQGKKQRKPKRRGKLYSRYKVEGTSVKRSNKSCPKCGQGFTMAGHKNRSTCGKCCYTEFSKKE